jgi:peptidyl-tRNA hydrolase, PTH1 family
MGLGNPGREYEVTRHNVGWWVIDHLADVWHFDRWTKEGDARATTGLLGTDKVRLLKPQTYMNLSGQVLKNYTRRAFWTPHQLLVVVDEVALPVGTFRIRARGSAGGHNGLKSVEEALGTQDYPRLRIGVGPSEERKGIYTDLADFVLAPFARDERQMVVELIPRIREAIECWVKEGIEPAMNRYNRQSPPASE